MHIKGWLGCIGASLSATWHRRGAPPRSCQKSLRKKRKKKEAKKERKKKNPRKLALLATVQDLLLQL